MKNKNNMNIFQKIGNKLEEDKKREKKRLNRYWKLSSNERVEYDDKLECIERIFRFPMTRRLILIFLGCVFLIILSMSSYSQFSLNLQGVGKGFLWLFFISITFDLLNDYVRILRSDERREELNKRFGL